MLDAAVCGDLVDACDNLQLLGPHTRIERDGPGQDIGVICLGGIHAAALQADLAALNIEAVQTAIVSIQRATRGERHSSGIDEGQAIDHQTRRIGNDDVGPLACDLQRPHQARLSGGIDFIDDDPGAAVGQPWIALHPATNLGLYIGAAVVEDGSLLSDVELLVGVAADATCRRGLDIDRGGAVG